MKIPAYLALLILAIVAFYSPFFLRQKLPIPADAIVGLYHPYRDLYSNDYPRGIPFKNFLVTDPVRQTFVWKELAIENMKSWSLPLWNQYEMAGKPLLGNFQSSPLYPLNLILLIRPFYFSWSVFILSQSLLLGFFMYIYLTNIRLSRLSSAIGALALTFSGFSISWLEWGNILHTALWLPLMLFSIDKIFKHSKVREITIIRNRELVIWCSILLFAAVSSFLAGHIQTFFYVLTLSFTYFVFRWFFIDRKAKVLYTFMIIAISFLVLTFLQWYQTLFFILQSGRSIDQSFQFIEGWFVPWQNLVQFLAPDFFGNPATGNYWGIWNYGEFVGYIGFIPLVFAFLAAVLIRRKVIYFYIGVFLVSVILMTQNFFSEIPFNLSLPFISTAQPTRIIFLSVFALCVLAAFGINYFEKEKPEKNKRKIISILTLFVVFLGLMWLLLLNGLIVSDLTHRNVSIRNFLLPSLLGAVSVIFITFYLFAKKSYVRKGIIMLVLAISFFDLLRFANKFTPFSEKEYLFPPTKVIDFISGKAESEVFRIAALNDEILPPNFSTYYRFQAISGYDPLYLLPYGEFVAALERNSSDITPPFGFNRILTPKNYSSSLFKLLNAKYLLTFDDISSDRYVLVMQEGKTRIYEDKKVMPRAFFVESVIVENDKEKHMDKMLAVDLEKTGVTFSDEKYLERKYSAGNARVIKYLGNEVIIETENTGDGFLVLLDSYYPLWKAKIDGSPAETYRTNYAFRGIRVPSGKHMVEFHIELY